MIVEENGATLAGIRDILEEDGYQVLAARHCVDALQQAADFRGPIDVLITGAEMKIFHNGANLADCFRLLRPDTRVLLTAGSALPPGPLSEDSPWGYLPKPFSPWELLERVNSSVGAGPQAVNPAFLMPY